MFKQNGLQVSKFYRYDHYVSENTGNTIVNYKKNHFQCTCIKYLTFYVYFM
jgi:hypothetical protein